jgi:hypothetical protein
VQLHRLRIQELGAGSSQALRRALKQAEKRIPRGLKSAWDGNKKGVGGHG